MIMIQSHRNVRGVPVWEKTYRQKIRQQVKSTEPKAQDQDDVERDLDVVVAVAVAAANRVW